MIGCPYYYNKNYAVFSRNTTFFFSKDDFIVEYFLLSLYAVWAYRKPDQALSVRTEQKK